MRYSRGRATAAVCAATMLAAAAALAAGPDARKGDLDGDKAKEHVRAQDVFPERPSQAPHFQIWISDECPEGEVTAPVSGVSPAVDRIRLLDADRRPGKEVFFQLDSTGRGSDEFGLAAWREFAAAPCRRPSILFRYPPAAGAKTPPGAEGPVIDSDVVVRNFEAAFAGREVRLDEAYMDGDDPISSPSLLRRTWHRYDAARDRYVRYRRTVVDRPGN